MGSDTMHVATFPKPRRSPNLFSDFNNLQFASVTALVMFVMFVLLLAFMTEARPDSGGVPVNAPKVLHPVSMPGGNREDAMTITIFRDGQVYFRSDRVSDLSELPTKIKAYLKDPDVEHKVYIKADARARWGTVKLVLQGVHDAGIARVAFLADQRHLH